MTSTDERLRRLERAALLSYAETHGLSQPALGKLNHRTLRGIVAQDCIDILAEHDDPPAETRSR